MLRRTIGYATYMVGAGALTALLSFAVDTAGMITRPKEAYGDYHIYLLVYVVGMALCIYGVNGSIQKFGSEDAKNTRYLASLSIRLFALLTIITTAAGVAVMFVWGFAISLAFFAFPWLAVFWWGRYIVRSRLDPKYEARLLVFGSLSKTICIAGFLFMTDDRDAMIYGDAMAVVLMGAFTFAQFPLVFGQSFWTLATAPVPRAFVKEVLQFTKPLWVGGQVFAASQELIGVFTTAVLGPAAMASMGSMRQFWQFAAKPMDFLGQASLPGLVAERDDRPRMFRDILRLCLVLFPLIGLCVAALAPVLLELLTLSVKFAEIPTMMLVLAAGVPSNLCALILQQYAIAEGYPKYTLWGHLGAVVAIGLTIYPLSVLFGVEGLAVAIGFGYVGSALTFVFVMRKDYSAEIRQTQWWWVVTTLATVIALLPIYFTRYEAHSWLSVFPATFSYLILLVLFRVVRLEDANRLIFVLRRRLRAT